MSVRRFVTVASMLLTAQMEALLDDLQPMVEYEKGIGASVQFRTCGLRVLVL